MKRAPKRNFTEADMDRLQDGLRNFSAAIFLEFPASAKLAEDSSDLIEHLRNEIKERDETDAGESI